MAILKAVKQMPDRAEFANYFREIQIKCSRLYSVFISDADLTISQYAMLNQLLSTKKMPMTEVGEKLNITKPAVTHLVDRLEAKGYLKRVAHPKDRRIHLIEIQPKGKKIAQNIQTHFLNYLLEAFGKIGTEERKTVVRFYALLNETISEALKLPEGSV